MNTCAAGALVTARSKRWLELEALHARHAHLHRRQQRALERVRRAPAPCARWCARARRRSPGIRPSGGSGCAQAASKSRTARSATIALHGALPPRGLLVDIRMHQQHVALAVLLQHRDGIGNAGERPLAHRRAERHDGAVDQRELALRRGDDRLQAARRRGASGAGARDRLGRTHRIMSACARASVCASAQDDDGNRDQFSHVAAFVFFFSRCAPGAESKQLLEVIAITDCRQSAFRNCETRLEAQRRWVLRVWTCRVRRTSGYCSTWSSTAPQSSARRQLFEVGRGTASARNSRPAASARRRGGRAGPPLRRGSPGRVRNASSREPPAPARAGP